MTKSPHLLSLPQELLCMTISELALADLLQARAACQALRKACNTLQVWRQLLQRSIGITLPKPFFLPKPIEECTARELERAIRTWDAPWISAAPVQTIRRDVLASSPLDNWRFDSRSMVMLPGGRWVLLSHRDRSVWYLDLSQDWTSTAPLEPRLLIPALPLPHGRRIVDGLGVTLAVDWTSEDALGSPSSSSAACELTLTRFNIAVFVCHVSSNASNRKVTRVDVHNVQVHYNHDRDRDGSDGARLCLGEHLSSFEDALRGGVESASLHGSMLAYTSACKHQVSLVDWREVNGKTVDEGLPGRCIAHHNITSIHLVPGNLILVGSESKDKARFFLHDWAKDYPLRDISSSHDDETCSTSCSLQPVWRFKAPYSSIPTKLASTQQQPLFVQDGIVRLVLPTAGGVYGLAVSIPGGAEENEGYASGDEGQGECIVTVKLSPLVKSAKFKSIVEKAPPIFTLDRAVGFARGRWDKQRRSNSEMFFARYTWPKDEDTDTDNTETQTQTQTETDLAYETKTTSPSTSPGFMGFATIPNPLDDLYRSRKYDVERASGICMFDPFTNRVVISNVSGSRVCTVFANKVTTSGEKDSGDSGIGTADCESLEDVSTLWPDSPVEEEVSGSRFIDLEDEVTTEEEEDESSGQSSDEKTTV